MNLSKKWNISPLYGIIDFFLEHASYLAGTELLTDTAKVYENNNMI